MPNLAESAVRMTCKVKIAGVSAQTFILKVRVTIEGNANFNNALTITGSFLSLILKRSKVIASI